MLLTLLLTFRQHSQLSSSRLSHRAPFDVMRCIGVLGPQTSCAIKTKEAGPEPRGQGPEAEILPHRPPGTLWVLQGGAGLGGLWAGCGPRGPQLGPWVAGFGGRGRWPGRPRGWLLCPSSSSVPAAAGRGLRPRVFSAHGPGPQLQVHAPAWAVTARPLAKRLQTGPAFLLQATFTMLPDLVPISDWRSSVNQGRGSLFRHTGCTTQ
jgi:hypothetical protein